MGETKYIIKEKQILSGVKYALELNIQESRIVDILMHDIEDKVETVLHDDCEEWIASTKKDGKWEEAWDNKHLVVLAYKCSECGMMMNINTVNFCPFCGIKMKKDKSEEYRE